ncbi:DUF397 domain-containing protein [Cryptosporangium aurantiacum]|uniref:DUF397 domain-containing protein n=1 Tax=Cryptosporangium aurantiacum TaxID=134849 RepID=A0A1M7KS22_9ACTN|nr:DUF397 domain-containing protein [Cryptosporangium aurantiacum]SHM67824.1 protein of unknown function [Cryptosporangium aurantiacum]
MSPLEPELDVSGARWRKSTRSGTDGNCVEVGTAPAAVGVRDTKDHGHGPVLAFAHPAWRAFLDGCKAGEFGFGR